MEKVVTKFHAMQLFTDTFIAETVHLTNNQLGIYTRLLNFHWTKNAKPFSTEDAYTICQCKDDNCRSEVDEILKEFFIVGLDKDSWTNKRVVQEHAYLTEKYKKRSVAGKKGGLAKRGNATSKNVAPIPIPSPIPNNNIYDPQFEKLWDSLTKKRGSKFKAHETWIKLWSQGILKESDSPLLIDAYNNQISDINDDKFMPHFSTWLYQRRWEDDQSATKMATILQKMEKLGYITTGTESNFTFFIKDGKKYKIDRYDKEHMILDA